MRRVDSGHMFEYRMGSAANPIGHLASGKVSIASAIAHHDLKVGILPRLGVAAVVTRA